jgi:hypothetical protein
MKAGQTMSQNWTKVHTIEQSFSQSKTFSINKISSRFVSLMNAIFRFTQILQILSAEEDEYLAICGSNGTLKDPCEVVPKELMGRTAELFVEEFQKVSDEVALAEKEVLPHCRHVIEELVLLEKNVQYQARRLSVAALQDVVEFII